MQVTVETAVPGSASRRRPRLRDAVVLVDGVLNGEPFKRACMDAGLPVIGVYTFDRPTLESMSPLHAQGDTVSLYGSDPHSLDGRLRELTESVAAVIPATEPGVCCAASLAARWGLPSNPVSTAAACRDKRLMRELARREGLRVPRHQVADSAEAVHDAALRIGFPVIVKPATGAASHNVFLVDGPAALSEIFEKDRRDLFGASVDQWLVEEYVRGREFAVNTFTVNGRHTVLDTWEYRMPSGEDYDNPYWDFVQLDEPSTVRTAVERFAIAVLEAFGIRIGPCHIEVKADEAGRPVLIEVGARLPGAGIPLMWERHSTWRPYHDTLACYLGRRPSLSHAPPSFDATIGMCFIRNDGEPGVLRELTGLDLIAGQPGVEQVLAPYTVGDLVPTTRDLGTELAKVRMSAPSGAALSSLIRTVRRTVRADIEREAVIV
ncbi:ATP-grasp domain-containing protein [Streptomyces sp. WMMB 322]|uniref:ATP-grasp domain-containing protein n=1 Tax=Streptomyces sp. WMMB 322 TaxID=1286821 RepID=UPI0006E25AF3|nr:ATP-grasp domain-containing protein [Streptomyces sp. WMMB 322]SCK10810.1 ATP-grasp domain-containing protein [Streptomyces sp. WMMB 322]